MEGVIEGRQIHYVMTGQEPGVQNALKHLEGQHRAATIVRAMGDRPHPGYVNLLVHVDGYNDLAQPKTSFETYPLAFVPQLWVTSVFFSEDKEPGTWHWIERA